MLSSAGCFTRFIGFARHSAPESRNLRLAASVAVASPTAPMNDALTRAKRPSVSDDGEVGIPRVFVAYDLRIDPTIAKDRGRRRRTRRRRVCERIPDIHLRKTQRHDGILFVCCAGALRCVLSGCTGEVFHPATFVLKGLDFRNLSACGCEFKMKRLRQKSAPAIPTQRKPRATRNSYRQQN